MRYTTVRNIRRAKQVQAAPSNPAAYFSEHYGCSIGGVTKPMPPSTRCGDSGGVVSLNNRFIVYSTDATGKGENAAGEGELMKRAVLSSIAAGVTAPAAILRELNRTLIAHGSFGAATILHCDGDRAIAASAGAPAPAIYRAGRMERFTSEGTLLGCSDQPEFDICVRKLQDGDFISVFGDGVTEAEDPATGEFFDIERFSRILDPGYSIPYNLVACLNAVLDHSGQQQDDITLALVHLRGGVPGVRVPYPLSTKGAPYAVFDTGIPGNGFPMELHQFAGAR